MLRISCAISKCLQGHTDRLIPTLTPDMISRQQGMERQRMIRIDVSRPAGTIRRLHGTNLAAPMARGEQVVRDLQELRIPLTHLHDAPLENPGMRLVDISMVFPRFDADPQDPAQGP